MSGKSDVPTDLKESFDRLIKLIPVPYRGNKDIQQTIQTYLKQEGEEFVRDGIRRTLKHFDGQ